MCLIIVSKSNSPKVSEEILKTSYDLNQDGIGVSYSLNNELFTKKDFIGFIDFYQYYLNIPNESSILVHFRKSSAGGKIPDNIHPFLLENNENNNKTVWCLNGTVADHVVKDSDKSDCYLMNEIIISPIYALDNFFYEKDYFKALLKSHVKAAKMVFFNNSGEFTILNEILGEWVNDKTTWFSNTLFKAEIERIKKLKNPVVIAKYSNNNYCSPIKSGTPFNPKKKYYLRSDKLFQELSLDEIHCLQKLHHKGVRKLLKKGIIGKLNSIPQELIDKIDNQRYEQYWKGKEILQTEIVT